MSNYNYHKDRTLSMFTTLKKFDDSSKSREFKAKLMHLCDLELLREQLVGNFRELGYPFYPQKGSPDYEEVQAKVSAYSSVHDLTLGKIAKQEKILYRLSGLSLMSRVCPRYLKAAYNRYALEEISYEEFIEEIKGLIWIYYKDDALECPEIVADNLHSIGLLPKKVLKGLKSNLFEQKKDDATEHSTLIVEKIVKIELTAKNI